MIKKELIGIIPAAGKGTRLLPFPCPKELFPVGYQVVNIEGQSQKRPKVVSQYLVENMIHAGVKKLYIILGEGKSQIMEYYGNGSKFGINICYLYQEELLGMPFALNLIYPWNKDAAIVFGMPDTIIEPHNFFEKLIEYHNGEQADLTLGLFPTDFPQKFGMVEIDHNNNVIYTVDKPVETNLELAWGCACWSEKFSILMNEFLAAKTKITKEVVLGDVFNYAIENKLKVKAITDDNARYIDIGTSNELDTALKKFHL